MKKKIIIAISIILLLILITIGSIFLIRYTSYKDYIGTYKLVEGEYLDNLTLNLYDWNLGKKEDLKCSIWECTGYEEGNKYVIKDNKIYFYFNSYGVIIYNYEFNEVDGSKYLILKDNNFELKYKKV